MHVALLTAPAWAGPSRLRGVGFDETLASGAVLADALNQAGMRAQGLPLYARIVVAADQLAPADGPGGGFAILDERVERYRLKGIPVILALTGPLPTATASDAWLRFLSTIAERYHGRIGAYQIGDLTSGGPIPDVHDYAFVLKLAAVQLRAADPGALIVQGCLRPGDLDWEKALFAEDVAAYLDAVAIAGRREDLESAIPGFETLLSQQNASVSLVIAGFPLSGEPTMAVRDLLDWQLFHLATKAALTTYTATVPAAVAVLPAVDRLKALMTAELVPVDDKSAGLRMIVGGEDVTSTVAHALFYGVNDLGTYLIYRGHEPSEASLGVELADPSRRKVLLRDILKGRDDAVSDVIWDQSAHITRVRVPLADRPLILDLAYGETAYVSRAEVSERVLPPVAEIVFRHQLAQTVQDRLLETYIANARMESHFRPSATDSGFDVVTENRFYSDKEGSEWEETSFTLNGTRWGSKRPPFPLLQPEKVLSLPLDLRLTKDYRYRLEGVEKVGERECYAVRFDPFRESQSLYRGTVWIDTKSFSKVKVQAVQTHLGIPVVSNEEIQYFTPESAIGDQPVYLLSRFTSRQILLIAGRNLLVERMVRLSDFEVNTASFLEKRAASRAGKNIMFRDTDNGLRYFVKRGDTRVVEEHPTTSAKALAVGVTIDPSFDFPLPILGIDYLNFNFLSKDTQLAVLFGGVLALGNIQRPKAFGERVDVSADLFAIAVRVNDQVFDTGGEVRSERLRDRPLSTGLNVGYQLTSFQKLVGSYQFRFDAYSRDDGTAADFAAPVSTVTNGIGLAYEYRRAGYSFVANGFHYVRGSWRTWGRGDEFSADQRSYDRFSVSLSKDFFFAAVHKIHLNAAYFGGRRLDRFSMYQFGLFDDTRIHGVPSAGVRFSDLAMFRGGYSFNLFDQYRLDLFFDQAIGRERPRDAKWRNVTGIGLGVNLRAFFGTLLRGEIGKSFLAERYRGSGSVVGQIMFLKPL